MANIKISMQHTIWGYKNVSSPVRNTNRDYASAHFKVRSYLVNWFSILSYLFHSYPSSHPRTKVEKGQRWWIVKSGGWTASFQWGHRVVMAEGVDRSVGRKCCENGCLEMEMWVELLVLPWSRRKSYWKWGGQKQEAGNGYNILEEVKAADRMAWER